MCEGDEEAMAFKIPSQNYGHATQLPKWQNFSSPQKFYFTPLDA